MVYPPLPNKRDVGVDGAASHTCPYGGVPPPSQPPTDFTYGAGAPPAPAYGADPNYQAPQYGVPPPQPTYDFAGGNNNASAYPPIQNESDTSKLNTFDQEYQSNNTSSGNDKPCCGIFGRVLAFIIAVVIWELQLWAQLAIFQAIGETEKWLNSLAWAFLGIEALAILATVLLWGMTFCFVKHADDITVHCVWIIWTWIFLFSTGLPYAQTASQAYATDIFLSPSTQRTLHCWRNNNDDVTATNTNYISLAENHWRVAYEPWKQKMYTQVGTEEDEDADKRYNYCIAPIVYTGQAPNCAYNFWAVCYKETSNHNLASCAASDAATCGWDFTPATIIMRTLNQNAEFFADMEAADQDNWEKARGYTSKKYPAFQQGPVLVEYASDGPEAMQALQTQYKDSLNVQFICYMVIYGVLLLIYGSCYAFAS